MLTLSLLLSLVVVNIHQNKIIIINKSENKTSVKIGFHTYYTGYHICRGLIF